MPTLLTPEEHAELAASFEQRSEEYRKAVREEAKSVRKMLDVAEGSTAVAIGSIVAIGEVEPVESHGR